MNVYWGTGNNLIFDWSEPSWYYDWNNTVTGLTGSDYLLMTNSSLDKKKISIEDFGADIAGYFVFEAISDIPNRGVNGADKILKVTSANDGYEWVEYNSTNWNTAYSNYITGISVTGTDTKTITLTQQDGGTISDSFTDLQGSGTSPWNTDTYGINYQGGNVGIGENSGTSYKLSIDATGSTYGLEVKNSTDAAIVATSNDGVSVSGAANNNYGIKGYTQSSSHSGVFGESGLGYGVFGQSQSNYGVWAYSENSVGLLSTTNTTTEYSAVFNGGKGVNSIYGYSVNGTTTIDSNGFTRPVSSTDANAPNNSIYFSTTQSKLVYKDDSGTVHTLY